MCIQNGNISELLLQEGFAHCADWSMKNVTRGSDKLRAAERYKQHLKSFATQYITVRNCHILYAALKTRFFSTFCIRVLLHSFTLHITFSLLADNVLPSVLIVGRELYMPGALALLS